MKHSAIIRLLMLAALVIASAQAANRTGMPVQPAITLRVVDDVGIDNRVLSSARKQTIQIMRDAGISLIWRSCDGAEADASTNDPCHADRGPLEFWLRITEKKPPACSQDMLAFSEIDDVIGMRSAAVYYPAVSRVIAGHLGITAAKLLGGVMAHEIGHLILGADAHARTGVMSPHWNRSHIMLTEAGLLSFDPFQAQLLRREIARRQAAPALGTIRSSSERGGSSHDVAFSDGFR